VAYLLVALAALGHAGPGRAASSYDALVAAEHAFAERAAVVGVRDAFVEWFADDNLVFAPGPVDGRAHWRARPILTVGAAWKPAFAEVSAAGDLGYTLGPHRWFPLEDASRTVDSGHFFSAWQRGPDGGFVNVFDHGITHPPVELPSMPRRRGPDVSASTGPADEATRAARLQALVRIDRALAALDGASAARDAIARPAADLLLMRDGAPPRAAMSLPVDTDAPAGMDLATLRMASSADLGFTAGWNGDADAAVVYVRVWRHDGRGWRLAVDLLQRRAKLP
jgi:hypothetical protein